MDFWQRARSFAEEAAKKSQEIVTSANLSEVVSEASKRSKELAAEASKKSKELAAEASKKSKEIAAEALKRADQITAQLPPAVANFVDSAQNGGNNVVAASAADLEMFGVTDELRDFIKGITINTFQDFPLQDEMEMSDIPAVSNVRQDLTEWQERHAKLVLSTVKEISKLRYQLCPRVMKERKFWRIYFILVNSHVGPYEKRYMEDVKLKSAENVKETEVKESAPGGISSENVLPKQQSKNAKPAASDQDLDVFLLGDGDEDSDGGDGGPDDGDDGFEDDFDKI